MLPKFLKFFLEKFIERAIIADFINYYLEVGDFDFFTIIELFKMQKIIKYYDIL